MKTGWRDELPQADVSVALCSFNGAKYVAAQIESVLAQDHRLKEIVVCDDGSTDATVEQVASTLLTAARIGVTYQLIRNEKTLGYTKNFEKAISLCSGAIVFLCDQDDVWLGDKISSLVPALASERALFVFSDAELVGPDLAPRGGLFRLRGISAGELAKIASGQGLSLLFQKHFATGATAALKAGFARLCMPFPETGWSHDEWLALWAAAAGGLVPLTIKTTLYRQHGANQFGVPLGLLQNMSSLWKRLRMSTQRRHSVVLADKARPLRTALQSGLSQRLGVSAANVEMLAKYADWMERRSAACRTLNIAGVARESRNPFAESDPRWIFAFVLDALESISFHLAGIEYRPRA